MSSIGTVMFNVYGSEGTIPHVHIETKDKKFQACLCLLDNKYFNHKTYLDEFNNKQLKIIDNFMSSKSTAKDINNKENGDITVWEYMCEIWNRDSDNKTRIDVSNSSKPDYTKTEDSIHKLK